MSFVNKINLLSAEYGKAHTKTLNAVIRNIDQHEERLRVINSSEFQFANVENVLDRHTEDLCFKIRDTIGALRRRAIKAAQVEQSMIVKIRTMLE